MIKTRLRDFIITEDDWIFAVADYFHPNGIRSTLRYVPDDNGERQLNGTRYRKYDFDDAFEFMRKHRPEWVEDVHVVPVDHVKRVLHSNECIPQLVKSDRRVAAIVKTLQDAGIPLSQMGVTGSLLPGLQIETSDIDFVVYGSTWFAARDAISMARQENARYRSHLHGVHNYNHIQSKSGIIEDINDEMWQRIYNKRIPEIPFDEFILHEQRKGNRGMVEGTYFDLLFVRDWGQIKEPMQRGEDIGSMKIEATVTNADFAFDSPSVYKIDHENIDHENIDHVLSYTHTYAGQALAGEVIEAQGMVEQVGDIKRLVVGTSREPRGEWIRSLTLLEECGYI